jgi:hypothetical protein
MTGLGLFKSLVASCQLASPLIYKFALNDFRQTLSARIQQLVPTVNGEIKPKDCWVDRINDRFILSKSQYICNICARSVSPN